MRRWLETHLINYVAERYLTSEPAQTKAQALEFLSRISFPRHKPPALVTLDDRAITFTGEFPPPKELRDFKPWNKR